MLLYTEEEKSQEQKEQSDEMISQFGKDWINKLWKILDSLCQQYTPRTK